MAFNGFTKPFVNAFHGFGKYSTAAAIGAGAAALAAPALFKTDDRGYARTAAVTTPLIAAGFVGTPGPWNAALGASATRMTAYTILGARRARPGVMEARARSSGLPGPPPCNTAAVPREAVPGRHRRLSFRLAACHSATAFPRDIASLAGRRARDEGLGAGRVG